MNDLGPDGTPVKRASMTTTSDGVDDAGEIGWPNSDDFQSILEKPMTQATLVDLFYYRVFLEMRKAYILSQGLQEPLTAAQTAAMVSVAKPQTVAMASVNLAQSLLAPELIAGQRMDLNRPFGDGRDNGDGVDNDGDNVVDETNEDFDNDGIVDKLGEGGDPYMNGQVDDPLEAGEPFLDVKNANNDPSPDGTYELGEPFIDLDGNGFYSPPLDRLWPGLTGEAVSFDYTNGQGTPIHPAVALASSGAIPPTAQVRNLNSAARQLYARHLYCLMLLLVDEGYLRRTTQTILKTSSSSTIRFQIAGQLTSMRRRPQSILQQQTRKL